MNVMPSTSSSAPPAPAPSRWHLVSNHGLVLLTVAQQPTARIRDIAAGVGITDRACQRILNELVDAGYISRRRMGRRNEYVVDTSKPMPHSLVRVHNVAELVTAFTRPASAHQPAPTTAD